MKSDLLSLIYPSQGDVYTYDNLGEQTTSFTDRNNTCHGYTYDTLGRLTTDQVVAGAFGLSLLTTVDGTTAELKYTYTDAGQLATATSRNGANGVLVILNGTALKSEKENGNGDITH